MSGWPIRTPTYAPWHESSQHFYAEMAGDGGMIVGALRPRLRLRRALLASTALASTALAVTALAVAAVQPAMAQDATWLRQSRQRRLQHQCQLEHRPGAIRHRLLRHIEHHQPVVFAQFHDGRRLDLQCGRVGLQLHKPRESGPVVQRRGHRRQRRQRHPHQQRLSALQQFELGRRRDPHQQRLPVFQQFQHGRQRQLHQQLHCRLQQLQLAWQRHRHQQLLSPDPQHQLGRQRQHHQRQRRQPDLRWNQHRR